MEDSDGYPNKKISLSWKGTLFSKQCLYFSLTLGALSYILSDGKRTDILDISQGKLQGFISHSRNGRQFSEFWGIPYAEPPLGKLRFQSPVPAHNWTGVKVANQKGIECLQLEFMFTSRILGQEDCLYLNVFTPQDSLSTAKFPVVVFIHGGGFMVGSSKLYKANYFMDEDVVLVTFNYRLGALGFLNTGDEAALGNMGLKDQNMALRWIQDNIQYFGGDSNRVTLVGESAGAVSSHLHTMSPMSKGLFHKVISFSGIGITHWGFVQDAAAQAERFVEKLNCNNFTIPLNLLDCLQKKDAKEIVQHHLINRRSMSHPLDAFAVTVENVITEDTFLSRAPQEIFASGDYSPVPWLTGINEAEGLLWYARVLIDDVETKKIQKISKWYKNLPRYLGIEDLSEENARKITKYYFNEEKDFNPIDKITNMTNMFGDRMFHLSYNEAIKFYHNQSNYMTSQPPPPLYLYYYTHRGYFDMFQMIASVPTATIFPSEIFGGLVYVRDFFKMIFGMKVEKQPACHADELPLLFDFEYIFTVTPTSRDFSVSAELIKMIADFSAGNDNTMSMQFHGRHWPAVSPESEVSFMRIDSPERSGLIPIPFAERLRFWEKLKRN